MPHGAPDFYQYRINSPSYTLSDLAELAVRLDGLPLYDGRGDVAWVDSFENGDSRWSGFVTGGTNVREIVADTALHGASSMKLVTQDAIAPGVFIRRDFPLRTTARHGFEVSWSNAGDLAYWILRLEVANGSTETRFDLRVDAANNRIQYLDSAGAYQTAIDNVTLLATQRGFMTTKIVIDPVTQTYVRMMHDANSVSLTNVAGEQIGVLSTMEIQYFLYLTASSGGEAENYADAVVGTWNEPPEP